MDFSLKEQFKAFVRTPQIFPENAFFEYPLFQTNKPVAEEILQQLTEPATKVLGKRMEDFFQFYINHFSSLEVLACNRQIICKKETIGELDFLLKDPASGKVSHVELVYKFYLYDPESGTSEKDHLIGPNKRDSLNRKLVRLQKRQFPLLFHEATQELLQSLEINPGDVEQAMCFKAFVFLPKQFEKVTFSEINPEIIIGYWIRLKEFTEEVYGQNMFFSPKKKYWPLKPDHKMTWLSYPEIMEQVQHFMEKELSLLMWMKKPNGEIEKFFIVWW
jgi:hypothetical protein